MNDERIAQIRLHLRRALDRLEFLGNVEPTDGEAFYILRTVADHVVQAGDDVTVELKRLATVITEAVDAKR